MSLTSPRSNRMMRKMYVFLFLTNMTNVHAGRCRWTTARSQSSPLVSVSYITAPCSSRFSTLHYCSVQFSPPSDPSDIQKMCRFQIPSRPSDFRHRPHFSKSPEPALSSFFCRSEFGTPDSNCGSPPFHSPSPRYIHREKHGRT